MPLPTLCRIVRYRSRTAKYSLAAIVTADVTTLFREGVAAGNIPDLTDETHVHLTVFTPGFAGRINPSTDPDMAAAMVAKSTPAGGSYQEWDVAEDQSGETPGTWSWPPRD